RFILESTRRRSAAPSTAVSSTMIRALSSEIEPVASALKVLGRPVTTVRAVLRNFRPEPGETRLASPTSSPARTPQSRAGTRLRRSRSTRSRSKATASRACAEAMVALSSSSAVIRASVSASVPPTSRLRRSSPTPPISVSGSGPCDGCPAVSTSLGRRYRSALTRPGTSMIRGHEVVPALGNDDIGVAFGGFDVEFVHRLDRVQVLVLDRLQGPPAVDDIAFDPSQQAHIGVGVDEELDVEQSADPRLGEDEDALDDDHPGGFDQGRCVAAVVDREVVDGAFDRSAGPQRGEVVDEEIVVEGVEVVVVDLLALLVAQLVAPPVVVVVVEHGGRSLALVQQRLRQRRLSA